jgi:hypothetical protein
VIASLNASSDNPRLSSDSTLYKPEIVEFSEDVMLCERSEYVMFEKDAFFLSTRAAEENVAGKIKLTAINSKHLAIRGIFFSLILCNGSGREYKLKA